MNHTDTATIEGIKMNPEFVTFETIEDMRNFIMGEEEAPAPERAPLAVRRFVAHIRRYTMNPNTKDADRVMVLANKVADRYFTTSRAFHYAELALNGHGRHAIKYIVQDMERAGYTLEGVTTDCTPAPKKEDPNACGKCGGAGYLPHYYYIAKGECFSCGGTGKK